MHTITPDKLAADTRQELTAAERRVADATAALHRAEGERDKLVLWLTDLTGCHDRRPTAVR